MKVRSTYVLAILSLGADVWFVPPIADLQVMQYACSVGRPHCNEWKQHLKRIISFCLLTSPTEYAWPFGHSV